MPQSLLEALKSRPLLGDGAMGTQLMLAGLEQGSCGELWNLEEPQRVLEIQRRYVQAGSDCLITNTFGANALTLERHGIAPRVAEINRAAAALARQAFDGRPGYVLGDIGPFGGMLEPYGEFQPAQVRAAFLEQAQALVAAGVDAIIIETQTALEELALAVEAARQAGAACIIASMAFDVTADLAGFRTMMGVSPQQAVPAMERLGADIIALNCGAGMDMPHALQVVRIFRQLTQRPIMMQPNAGQPRLEDGKLVYTETPAAMAAGVVPALQAGAQIVGACCGSTPEHIAAFRQALNARQAK